MSVETVKKYIDSGQIPPLFLWYGEDRYSIVEALKILKQPFLQEDPSGSLIELFSAKEVSLLSVTEAAKTCTFFSKKMVIVDDLDFNELSDEDSLLEYCRTVNPSTCLVLIAEKVNRGRKLFKEAAKIGVVCEFAYPKSQYDWQLWIQNEAKSRGKTISPAAASFLLDWAGHYTGILSQELNKLAVYCGEKRTIEVNDIEKVCVALSETTIFAMVDAIAAGNAKDALHKLKLVLGQEHYLKVFTMIVRQVRLLLAASFLRKKGEPVERFMEITGIRSPFEGNKIYRQAANFTSKELAAVMEDCLRTDTALKTSGGDPHLLLELMVIRFCHKLLVPIA